MAFKRFKKQESGTATGSFSFSVPLKEERKRQLLKEIEEMVQGKREGVEAMISELIEIIYIRNMKNI